VIALLTTSRKALAGALIAFLGPLAALFASDIPITARVVVGCLLSGAIAGLTVWATGNTDPYVPYGQHADVKEIKA
jgi:hypothetical protein